MLVEILAFIIFIAVIGILIWRDRRNIRWTGLVLMRRTARGKAAIDKIANSWPRFWNAWAIVGVIAALCGMVFIIWFLLGNTLRILSGQVVGAVKLVLPWPTIEVQPGLLLLPWYFWVIGVMAVIVPHELAHGIICRLQRIRIRSLGWFLMLFIPGAFVEPSKRGLQAASKAAKLRIYAAGSFANFIVAGIVWLLGSMLILTTFTPAGLIPAGLDPGGPAAAANMSGVLLSINGTPVTSFAELRAVLEHIPVGSNITVETTTGNFSIVTAQHPELGISYLGIVGPYQTYYVPDWAAAAPLLLFLRDLLFWVFVLSFGIGLFNLLPIKPLDGGQIFEELIDTGIKNRMISRRITIAISLAMIGLVVFNLVAPALM